jgi:uncharacterized phage protein gp47/JayE
MAVKSLQAILNTMKSYIAARYSTLDTSEGSMVSDIVIGAPAQEMALLYQQDQNTSDNQALSTANEGGLNIHGANLSAPRLSANPSQGVVTFFSYTQPTNDITIPAGTTVSTAPGSGGTAVSFSTLRDVTMFAIMAASYLNPDTGLYEIQSNVECSQAGSIGIVGSQAINSLLTSISGISGCYNNTATYGGTDVEDKDVYRQRLSKKWQGNALCTDNGILSLVLAYPGVEGAVLVGHGQSLRNEYGAIDVYVKGNALAPWTDTFLIDSNAPQQTYTLTKQPISILGAVQTVIYGASGSVATPGFAVLQDTGQYAGSVKGNDMIIWDSVLPSVLGTCYITYMYNKLITDLQNLFTTTANNILNANLLVRQADALPIDITANIKIVAGVDLTSVIFAIQSALALFFNSLDIGAEVQMGDAVREILNTPGVDDVQLPLALFRSTDASVLQNSFGDLVLPFNCYAISGNINITNILS